MIPLISDTRTCPTKAMRKAISSAAVGDEQSGGDPTVNELQERVAALLEKEAALWMPGGTMCNLVAVKAHTRHGDAVIADSMSHVIRAESAGAAFVSGVIFEPIVTERGVFTVENLESALEAIGSAPPPYAPRPSLMCVEQTHNFGGGSVWRADELTAVSGFAREKDMRIHMDGARLLNACIATGSTAAELARPVDSVWIDFTKGLGAPVGAVLAGSQAFVDAARRLKHVFGGAMRQAGIVAAGCLHALDHHVERLQEDHDNARRLARELAGIDGMRVDTPNPESNIVLFNFASKRADNARFIHEMSNHGVSLGLVGTKIRAVTHLDVSAADIDTAIRAAKASATALS